MKYLWQVKLPYATFGIDEEDGKIIAAAPIGRWMIGKSISKVRNWVLSKGGTLTDLGAIHVSRNP